MNALHPFDIEPMKRLIFKIFAIVTLVCVGCVAYGLFIEPKTLEVRGPEFISPKYTGPPIRIGIITDIHIGGMHVPPRRVEKLVADMNKLKPDLVLLPGDFVGTHLSLEEVSDEFKAAIKEGISYLGDLDAPAFAVLGNHDNLYDRGTITRMIEMEGLTVLENKAVKFDRLCIVGLGDYKTSIADRAAYNICPQGLAPLAFTHSPQAWESFRSDTILAIAGHTHGGQVNLPIYGRRVNSTNLGPEHSYGFSKLGGVDVFVSAGVGTSILPVRFRAPPEVVVITLRASR